MAGRAVFREEKGPRRKKKSGDFSPEHHNSASMRSSLTLSSLDLDLSQLGAETRPIGFKAGTKHGRQKS
jgi:hypothetical protein